MSGTCWNFIWGFKVLPKHRMYVSIIIYIPVIVGTTNYSFGI